MRARILQAALLAFLFVQGVLLGTIVRLWNHEPAAAITAPVPVVAVPAEIPAADDPEISPEQHRQIAEELLVVGNARDALPHLLAATQFGEDETTASEMMDEPLSLRLALCLEAAGDCTCALSLYKRLAADSASASFRLASINGSARCYLAMRQADAARESLWRIWQVSGGSAGNPQTVDSMFLLVSAMGGAVRPDPQRLIDPSTSLERILLPLDVARELQLASQPAVEGVESQQDSQGVQARRFGPGFPDALVDLDTGAIAEPLPELLNQLSQAIEVPLRWSDAAQAAAGDRRAQMQLHDVDPGVAMDALTLPYDLCWAVQGEELLVSTTAEAPREVVDQVTQNAAMRILEWAMLASPDHPSWGHVNFVLAALELRLGRRDEARQRCEQLLERSTDARLRQAASFSLAGICHRDGQLDEAISRYHDVVDSPTGGWLQVSAWLRIGHLYLETGRLSLAAQAFSRASRISDDREVVALARLRMANCHWLAGRPEMAARVINESRAAFADTELVHEAELVAATGRALPEHPDAAALQPLLAALTRCRWAPEQGQEMLELMAAAWETGGFPDEALEVLRLADDAVAADWLGARLWTRRVRLLRAAGRLEEARTELSESSNGELSPPLNLALAEIARELGESERCLAECRKLLANEQAADLYPQALGLMGRVLAERGEHYAAALCFSGLLPVSLNEDGGAK